MFHWYWKATYNLRQVTLIVDGGSTFLEEATQGINFFFFWFTMESNV